MEKHELFLDLKNVSFLFRMDRIELKQELLGELQQYFPKNNIVESIVTPNIFFTCKSASPEKMTDIMDHGTTPVKTIIIYRGHSGEKETALTYKPDNNTHVYWLPKYQYAIITTSRSITLYYNEKTRYLVRNIIRLSRQLIINYSETHGGILIHGGLTSLGNSGIAIVGPKGLGKTTFITKLLSQAPKQDSPKFIANDRFIVHASNLNEVMAYSIPLSIRIGSGTYIKNEEFSTLFDSKPPYRNITNHWMQSFISSSSMKISIMPREFCDAVNASLGLYCRLSLIIIPSFSVSNIESKVKKVSRRSAANKLKGLVLTPVPELPIAHWLGSEDVSLADLQANADKLKLMLLNIPMFEVQFGPDSTVNEVVSKLSTMVTNNSIENDK